MVLFQFLCVMLYLKLLFNVRSLLFATDSASDVYCAIVEIRSSVSNIFVDVHCSTTNTFNAIDSCISDIIVTCADQYRSSKADSGRFENLCLYPVEIHNKSTV